jgi:hypothetical protein
VDWNSFVPAAAPVAVRVADLNADLGNLARYSWWSLEKGAPVEFIATDAAAKAGQTVLAASRVRTPWFPASHLRVSPGFQSKYMVSQDRRVFLAYVRNVGGVLPQNARTRSPKKLTIQLSHLGAGNLEVWDLDHRVLLQAQTFEGRADLDLGVTRHDFAVFVFPK